ncbi:MAG: diacylglycerol kinase [Rhodobacterales bacterium]|jgi:diacylglycerol kinase (ATP)|nr:diacylglycerol kinase [Rhodobacterales bacterium]
MWKQLERVRLRAVWSWEGFIHVVQTEGSLHQWLWANLLSAFFAFILPLSAGERGMILMGGIIVLAAECMNTAIERVVDDVSEERRPRAKQAKDAGSACVAVSAVAVGVAWVCVLVGLAV